MDDYHSPRNPKSVPPRRGKPRHSGSSFFITILVPIFIEILIAIYILMFVDRSTMTATIAVDD